MSFIRNFMMTIGPISSLFDFITFGILLYVFNANERLFQTGWFVESLATKILVIFLIGTQLSPFVSRPHPVLAISSCTIALLGVFIPYSFLGPYFEFLPLPASFLGILFLLCITYLTLVEVGKSLFYRYKIAEN